MHRHQDRRADIFAIHAGGDSHVRESPLAYLGGFRWAGGRRPSLLLCPENVQKVKQALTRLISVFEMLLVFLSPSSPKDSKKTYVLSLCVLFWMIRVMQQAAGEQVVEQDRLWRLIDGTAVSGRVLVCIPISG